MSGAVAAGSPLTVEAGLSALRAGGNAVDAAVAAQLMACVAEPSLTGLGGGGLATLRVGGEVWVCDMFGDVPGRADPTGGAPLTMDEVVLDFGRVQQAFHVGPASVAVPGVPTGLWAIHQRWGRLPMPALAAPAVRAARLGVEVDYFITRVFDLLWPILKQSAALRAIYGQQGRDHEPKELGDRFEIPRLGDTIERLAAEGPGFLQSGEGAEATLRALSGGSRMSREDLAAYRPHLAPATPVRYRDATIWLPGPPSAGGVVVRSMLELLAGGGPLPGDAGPEEVERVLAVQRAVADQRGPSFAARLFEPSASERFLAACRAGFTTHLSAVDGDGDAVGITSSLGETAALYVPETGIVLNNFLGEEDVNPPHAPRPVGERLITMCCPTLIERQGRVEVMGSGGSSRIPTALLHGVLYMVDHDMAPADAVRAARVHLEESGEVRIELHGRPSGVLSVLRARGWSPHPLEPDNLYFGGLHVAGMGDQGPEGAGDPRRDGRFGVVLAS